MKYLLKNILQTILWGFLFVMVSSALFAGAQPKFSIIPTTATTKTVAATANDTVQYRVTNNTNLTRTLITNTIPGITQVVTGGGCSRPFVLAPKASCFLTLNLDGSRLPAHVTKGPEVCKTKGPGDNTPDPFLCSQPSAADSLSITVVPATVTLVSIHVTPIAASIANGTFLQYSATGIFSNGTTQNLTDLVSWSSSNVSVASISNADGSKGLATATNTGQTTITATLGNLSDNTTLTVTTATLQTISVTPANASIPNGISLQYTATGIFSNGSHQDLTNFVSWASSTTAATISNAEGSKGLATGANPGATVISASFQGTSGNANLTVTAATLSSITVTPVDESIPNGLSQQYTATGNFSDGSTHDLTKIVAWTSSTSAAMISNTEPTKGLATGTNVGATVITARLGAIAGSTNLSVTAAVLTNIEVIPPRPSIASGTTQQFLAIGKYSDGSHEFLTQQVAWTSSNTANARVSNAPGSQGLAIGLQVGNAIITATLGSISGSANLTITAATLNRIEVEPVNRSIPNGTTQQFQATGIYTNGSTQDLTTSVTWSSSLTNVATISNAAGSQGLASSVSTGTTLISASLGSLTGNTNLTVSTAVLTSITISPNDASIASGLDVQYTATGHYGDNTTKDLTTQVDWSSSDESIAVISNAQGSEGLATTRSPGATTITATLDAVSGNTTLNVSAATLNSISIIPSDTTLVLSTTKQFHAIGHYSDNTIRNLTDSVTWSSSDNNIVFMSNDPNTPGQAFGNGLGTATISAKLNNITGNATVTVTNPSLTTITIKGSGSFLINSEVQLSAVGTYNNGAMQDITDLVLWTSSNNNIASVSNAEGSQGLVTTKSAGSVTISATLDGIVGTTGLTVLLTRPTTAFYSVFNSQTVDGCDVLATGYFDTCTPNTPPFAQPNGVTLTADGGTIYVANAQIFPMAVNTVTRCTVTGETLSGCTTAVTLPSVPTDIALNHSLITPRAYVTSGSIVYVCGIDVAGDLTGCTNSGYDFSTEFAVAFDIVLNSTDTRAYVTATARGVFNCVINATTGLFDSCTRSNLSGQGWGVDILRSDLGIYVTDKNGGIINLCPLNSTGDLEGCYESTVIDDLTPFPQPMGITIHGNNRLVYIADMNGFVAVCPIQSDGFTLGVCEYATQPNPTITPYFITLH